MTTQSPEALVTAFCAEWLSGTPESIAKYFAEDAVYHNIPMQPLLGRAAILDFLRGFIGAFGGIDFGIHHQSAHGNVVLNERTDRFTLGDKQIELPVMGVFEIADGKIAAWRDYFDMAQFGQLTQG
ncbi:limonene-1,2-epoxide hydrolase family protein [Nocardia sp. NBC_01327]|uniref:limonene-1,2-epoxide hydrolase family protein n=1 Tax=Nocardia sp. NBC_01327 TaxID=2903593 RepID=UPI002E11E80A|nr:nuclear transport factor 2 family protein [Nocardia sp. NBC_01327]